MGNPIPASQSGSKYTKETSARMPVMYFQRLAWEKLMAYVCLVDTEINGFCYVQRHGVSDFIVADPDDVFITEQVVTGASADVDGRTFAIANMRAADEGRADQLKLQWHSHVRGSSFFSKTDTDTIDTYGDAFIDWMISLVTNKRGEYGIRLDVYTPVRATQSMTIEVYDVIPDWIADEVKQDIAEMVTVRPPAPMYVAPTSVKGWKRLIGGKADDAVGPDDDETYFREIMVHGLDGVYGDDIEFITEGASQ